MARSNLHMVVAALSVSILACDDGGTEPTPSACESVASIEIEGGVQPGLSWTPRCAVATISVQDSASGEDLWRVTALPSDGDGTFDNALLPGISYGNVPPGATQLFEAQPLQQGTAYLVVLSVATSPTTTQSIKWVYFRP